jgi:hypothetical protein
MDDDFDQKSFLLFLILNLFLLLAFPNCLEFYDPFVLYFFFQVHFIL